MWKRGSDAARLTDDAVVEVCQAKGLPSAGLLLQHCAREVGQVVLDIRRSAVPKFPTRRYGSQTGDMPRNLLASHMAGGRSHLVRSACGLQPQYHQRRPCWDKI